jgi:hypothetical protein
MQSPPCRSLALVLGQLRRRLPDTTRFADNGVPVSCGSQPASQPAATAQTDQQCTFLSSPSSASTDQAVRDAQIPIAPCGTRPAHLSRVLSLEAFGHRPQWQRHRRDGPASETLHKSTSGGSTLTASAGPQKADDLVRRSELTLRARARSRSRDSPLMRGAEDADGDHCNR